MEAQIQAAMARIDEVRAERWAEARQDMLLRYSESTTDALMKAAAMTWRTERQLIEARLRNAMQEAI